MFVMADSDVAVFLLRRAPRRTSFLAWASLVGPQVALLHLPKGFRGARDGTPCRCEIYENGVAKEAIDAIVRRTTAVRSAPAFVFLQTRSGAALSSVSDPRIGSSDLTKVRAALWDFVEGEAASDPAEEPSPARIKSVGKTSTEAASSPPSMPAVSFAAKPWWCKLFRSAPGC
jgi:hypothetical protein